MKKSVSIIIVTTNELPLLKQCIQSIKQTLKKISIELIIVDNASTDGTKEYLSHIQIPFSFTVITNTHIEGFASNCNTGISHASGTFILLLNPDTRLYPASVAHLLHFMKTHTKAGICAPKLLNPDGSLQFSCRKFPTWKSFIVRRTPYRIFFPRTTINDAHLMKHINHAIEQKVDWVLGGCMCIRKRMIDAIGLLDTHYYLYVDDIDFCLRAWKAGWEVYYVPSAKVIHHHQAKSDRALFTRYSLYHFQSMIHFLFKHGFMVGREKTACAVR